MKVPTFPQPREEEHEKQQTVTGMEGYVQEKYRGRGEAPENI